MTLRKTDKEVRRAIELLIVDILMLGVGGVYLLVQLLNEGNEKAAFGVLPYVVGLLYLCILDSWNYIRTREHSADQDYLEDIHAKRNCLSSFFVAGLCVFWGFGLGSPIHPDTILSVGLFTGAGVIVFYNIFMYWVYRHEKRLKEQDANKADTAQEPRGPEIK